MQTRCNRKDRRRHGAGTLLAPLVVAILLGGAAPSNPVLSGPTAAVASQSGSGGGGP